jgi:hypothetical protein
MEKIKHLGSVSCTFAIACLFSAYSSISLPAKDCAAGSDRSITKKENLPVESGNRFPLEEKDTEKEDFHDNFFMELLPAEHITATIVELRHHLNFTPHFLNPFTSDLPLYLVKRAFII